MVQKSSFERRKTEGSDKAELLFILQENEKIVTYVPKTIFLKYLSLNINLPQLKRKSNKNEKQY